MIIISWPNTVFLGEVVLLEQLCGGSRGRTAATVCDPEHSDIADCANDINDPDCV